MSEPSPRQPSVRWLILAAVAWVGADVTALWRAVDVVEGQRTVETGKPWGADSAGVASATLNVTAKVVSTAVHGAPLPCSRRMHPRDDGALRDVGAALSHLVEVYVEERCEGEKPDCKDGVLSMVDPAGQKREAARGDAAARSLRVARGVAALKWARRTLLVSCELGSENIVVPTGDMVKRVMDAAAEDRKPPMLAPRPKQ